MQIGNKIIPPYHHDQDRQNEQEPSSVEDASKQFKLASASMVIKNDIRGAQREGGAKEAISTRTSAEGASTMQDIAVSDISDIQIFSKSLFLTPIKLPYQYPLASKFVWVTLIKTSIKQYSSINNLRSSFARTCYFSSINNLARKNEKN